MRALRSFAEPVTAYVLSPVEIERDAEMLSKPDGFTTQPMEEATQRLTPETDDPERGGGRRP